MNICILLIDALRPDHLGCYGYPKNTSPNIDLIAGKSVVFTNAFAQSNWTYPSIYSMIAGRYPSTLGITWFDQKIKKVFTTLPEFLSEKGYHTGIFSSFKILLNPISFCSHFNEIKEVRLDDTTTGVFTEWAKAHEDSFLLFHTGEYIHEPFCADKKYVDMFLPTGEKTRRQAIASDVVKSITGENTDNLRKIAGRINKHLLHLSKTDLEYFLACYDAGIYQVDKFVGDIHKILQNLGKPYLFIILADHGQSFMEHGVFGHGLTLYDEVIRVPLIIDYNDCRHSRVSATVQLMDIFPSLLEFLHLERDFKLDGISFAGALNRGTIENRMAFSEGYPNISIRKDTYKLITSYSKFWNHGEIARRFGKASTRSRLRDIFSTLLRYCPGKIYHLEKDRNESVNLRWREKDAYNNLNFILKQILAKIKRDSFPPEVTGIDEQVKKQLETLGYL